MSDEKANAQVASKRAKLTLKSLRSLAPGTRVAWDDQPDLGIVRRADNGDKALKQPAMWIEWPDGQRTEDYDDWALEHVHLLAAN